jgi:cysteine desulfuration protein SufE
VADLETIVETFDLLDDWEDRYRYLIDLGRDLPPFPEAERKDERLVPGCMSRVWMISRLASGAPPHLDFLADSDAHLVKGLIAVLLAAYSGKTPEEIAQLDINALFAKLGLSEHLSTNRRNGFFAMVERIKREAAAAAQAAA